LTDTQQQQPKGRGVRNSQQQIMERQAIARRMSSIAHKILVLSGKGGVGKSTVAVNLAVSLALAKKRVGLLDIDIHGPSVPHLLGLEDRPVAGTGEALLPVEYAENLKVMSIGFLLQHSDDAVIWRGPLKFQVIKQFLKDVEWGDLDYLVIDSPPGTGDEPLSIAQLVPDADGAIIVTTPQDVAIADVRRCVTFCRQVNLRVLGVIENMSGLVCPHCGKTIEVFKTGGGKKMAREMGVPFLGAVPLDPKLAQTSDEGRPYMREFAGSETARAFERAIEPIIALETSEPEPQPAATASTTEESSGETDRVRIAVPLDQGKVSSHFGHCEDFAFIDADRRAKEIVAKEIVPAPEHQPGLLPRWLAERGVSVVVAGGMGQRAIALFEQQGISVHVGAPSEEPEQVVRQYLEGALPEGRNLCDH